MKEVFDVEMSLDISVHALMHYTSEIVYRLHPLTERERERESKEFCLEDMQALEREVECCNER